MTAAFSRKVPPTEFPISLGSNRPSFLVDFPEGGAAVANRAFGTHVRVSDDVIERLRQACSSVSIDQAERVEASRDWWPLNIQWTRLGQIGGLAGVVVSPTTAGEVAEILTICNNARVPVTVAGGRSGCVGGTIPVFGGVSLDMCGISGIVDVDSDSLLVEVRTGTFGDYYEKELRESHGLTQGHWPQSINLATVGGWLACRGAGQLSNKYGKIEDMVVGLEVVLADGTMITTGGTARSAQGPDLNQLFVGSEGTLGVITSARLRTRPAPTFERRAAYAFGSFQDGLDATRRILRRGLSPAALRLYDAYESRSKFRTERGQNLLIVLDEGDEHVVNASFAILGEECATATELDAGLVEHWLAERNDVSSIPSILERGIVYDTLEITAPWSRLSDIYEKTVAAMMAVEHTLVASSHQSHGYTDGACLYFTFAGQPPEDGKDEYYNAVWDAGTRAVLGAGGNLSHHHGVGLNRARFMPEAHGAAFDSIVAIKTALDPNGILNPGKLGLPTPFGEVQYPGR